MREKKWNLYIWGWYSKIIFCNTIVTGSDVCWLDIIYKQSLIAGLRSSCQLCWWFVIEIQVHKTGAGKWALWCKLQLYYCTSFTSIFQIQIQDFRLYVCFCLLSCWDQCTPWKLGVILEKCAYKCMLKFLPRFSYPSHSIFVSLFVQCIFFFFAHKWDPLCLLVNKLCFVEESPKHTPPSSCVELCLKCCENVATSLDPAFSVIFGIDI